MENPWEYIDAKGVVSATKEAYGYRKAELQKEVNKMAKEANALLDSLEENEMKSPAYNRWYRDGQVRFGVQGKTYQQVQSEYWRTKNFLDAKTSTVQGAKEVLNQISRNTGYGREMSQEMASNYFKLASQISDYYKMTGESAKALDYQHIWEQVNIAVKNGNASLDRANYKVEEIAIITQEIGQINDELRMLQDLPDNEQGVESMANMPKNTMAHKIGQTIKNAATTMVKGIVGAIKGLFRS